MRIFLAALVVLFAALPLAAQEAESDRGILETFLEDKLSGAGREVTVTGFEGALSARATMEELSIADADGVWITLKGAVLDWSRAALLRGRVEVAELSAEEIVLTRLPDSGGKGVKRSEAKPFALPDLPVSIEIGRIRTGKLVLGAAVLGQDAVLTLDGSLSLAGGAGQAKLAAIRTDASGRFTVDASYANATRDLALDIALAEGADGIAAGLMGIPGGPPLEMTIKGAGPLSGFAADLALASEGVPRVTGRFTLAEPEDAPGESRFALNVSGDMSPLVAPRLQPFFGEGVELAVAGQRAADGALELSALDVSTGALTLDGTLALDPSGLPRKVDIEGTLAGPVLLPLSGPETQVGGTTLTARFDAAAGEDWQVAAVLTGLRRAGLSLGRAELTGQGTITAAGPAAITADIAFDASGLAHDDPALARALGKTATGTARIDWTQGGTLSLDSLALTAGRARAAAKGTLGAFDEGLPLDGTAQVALDDLARLAPLAGRALGGAAEARIAGRYDVLGGGFDVTLEAATRDLQAGVARLDPLLTGQGQLRLSATRDETGTALDALAIETAALSLDAGGSLSTAQGGFTLTGRVRDLALVDPGLSGPGTVEAVAAWEAGGRLRLDRLELSGAGADVSATGTLVPDDPALPADGKITLRAESLSRFSGLAGRRLAGGLNAELTGQGAVKGDFAATLTAQGQNLALGIAQLDRLLAGGSQVTLAAARTDGAISLQELDLATPALTARATGQGGGALALTARLRDLALVVPGFPGPLSVSGTATPQGRDWRLALDATGPGGTTAAVAGSVAGDGARADLSLSGAAPLGLANPFIAPRTLEGQARYDLRLSGPLALSSLSGQASVRGARLSAPSLNLAVTDIAANLTLANGRARIDAEGALGGGRVAVAGPVTLSAPYPGELSVTLSRAGLRDPALYDTTLDGQVTVTGPLAGGARIAGALSLGPTEVTVPSTGASSAGAIPDVIHRGASGAVQATRARAGLTKQDKGGGGAGRPYPLDLTVSAPGRIYVRGRGLDAELGGQLRLGGTTAAVIPQGQFELIRGRLDVLAKRFALTEGRVSLQGALDPYLRFVAETRTADITAQVVLEGRASQPEIRFLSDPELPEEEVLARLLFGHGLDSLSAVQAAQLAAAVATLAGGNGSGGLFNKLREGAGLDDLDIATTEEGGTQLKAGKYLSDNLYSEVTVDESGKSEINLNLDVTPNLTVKGHLGAEGDTGVGLFYERDY